ncbi:MAG: T9SS type A sorting domain-containing protein [Flavobacteriales bacterium]|nr:T9SS type A sorting domain-containing protein [Flavobacteriales bacterium]
MGNRRISWTVATQQGNDHFEVERSLDGSTWDVFASVTGAGNTQTAMSYEVLDDNSDILFEQPLIYYRVKQVDNDGNHSYTPVEGSSCSVLVYPNPASDHIIVAVPFAGADVRLVDAIGRVVEVRKAQGTTIRMDIGDLASGYYAVQLLFSGELLGSAVVVKF